MAFYFVHYPPDESPALFWRGLSDFAGQLIQINLNLLAHAVGDDPASLLPPNGTLVPSQTYRFGNRPNDSINLQPFAFTLPGGSATRPLSLPIGSNLHSFLDDPLDGERLDVSLPFYDEEIKLGTNGGGWFRNRNDDRAFHAATDFNTLPVAVFDVCAAAEGRILGKSASRIVISHTTPSGREFRTVYVHMDLGTVRKGVGDNIRRGEFLGRTDATISFIHLHFGVAVPGPPFSFGGVSIPSLWYFIDPWGVYDFRANNYLPTSGRIFEGPIRGAVHTVQWRAQPVFKTIPIARSTNRYRPISRVQVRARRNESFGGTFPAEHEQFLVWLEGDPDFFLLPLTQASEITTELQLLGLIQQAFFQNKRVLLEYRYVGDLRYIMAAWVQR